VKKEGGKVKKERRLGRCEREKPKKLRKGKTKTW
jgi:hypothetical protein